MSFEGQSSTETLVVDISDSLKAQLPGPYDIAVVQDVLTQNEYTGVRKGAISRPQPSSSRTSEDTLVDTAPKRAKKDKKAPKGATQPQKQVKEKLSYQIVRTFADQLSGGAKYIDPSDVLQRHLRPQKPASTRQGNTLLSNTSINPGSTTQLNQSTENLLGQSRQACIDSKLRAKYRKPGEVFCLDEVSTYTYLERLVERYGKVSHMGVLDSSYNIWLNKAKDGALLFKVYDGVCVVSGDPLCEWHKIDDVLQEFASYRKKLSLDITFLGATTRFAKYAESQKWVTMQFGVEKVLNPVSNPLLLEKGAGKRTVTSSKALLKKGTSLGIYIPKHGTEEDLQDEIMNVYDAWCSDKNSKQIIQAFVSVMDPLAMPGIMTYLYARDADGTMTGFLALRKMANGYHIDPCVSKPGSPRGTTELLILAAMSLLQSVGVDFLSLGFDPSPELGTITGVPRIALSTTRSIHRRSLENLPVGGKQAFYDKFHPDENLQNDMFVIIPTRGLPKIRHMKAIMHSANISINSVIRENMKRSFRSPVWNTESGRKTEQTAEQRSDTSGTVVRESVMRSDDGA